MLVAKQDSSPCVGAIVGALVGEAVVGAMVGDDVGACVGQGHSKAPVLPDVTSLH